MPPSPAQGPRLRPTSPGANSWHHPSGSSPALPGATAHRAPGRGGEAGERAQRSQEGRASQSGVSADVSRREDEER